MKWTISLAAKNKGKSRNKDKSKLRKYWRMIYPEKYVKDLVGKINGK